MECYSLRPVVEMAALALVLALVPGSFGSDF